MKRLLTFFMAAALVLSLAGCGGSGSYAAGGSSAAGGESQAGGSAATESGLVFGVSMPQLDNDGFKANLIGIEQFAEENGIELVVTDAKATADTQMQQIEDLITKKVDAIVMCPVDSGAAAAAVQKAVDANIPVISFDRNVEGDLLTGLAESDNVAHGAAAADLMAEVAEKSGIAVEDLIVLSCSAPSPPPRAWSGIRASRIARRS